MNHCLEIDERVRKTGACNTLYRKEGRGWYGTNTDICGFIQPLLDVAGDLQGKKVTVLGAGGAAKAAVFALVEAGAAVLVCNRTLSRAVEIAGLFGCEYAELNPGSHEKIREYSTVIVNTTTCGMHPLEDCNPLSGYCYSGTEIVYDMIYRPERTLFLQEAEVAGARIMNGSCMLFVQGRAQYRLFTGSEYPDITPPGVSS